MTETTDAPGYYINRKDGTGDLYACARCVRNNNLSTESPVDPEVLAWAPLGCGIHVYGANPDDYETRVTPPKETT